MSSALCPELKRSKKSHCGVKQSERNTEQEAVGLDKNKQKMIKKRYCKKTFCGVERKTIKI